MSNGLKKRDQVKTGITTYFAPAERASSEELDRELREVAASPLFQAIQDSIDGYLMILNPQRQVLAVNKQLLANLGLDKPDCLIGERPGEILNCIHASQGPGGCGTSRTCSTCGAVISIVTSQMEGRSVIKECLATVKRNSHTESAEFRVRATPVKIAGHDFTILVFQDISGDKRREILERTFFHDILNTIGGLLGWSQILERFEDVDPKEVATRIVTLSQRLSREVQEQRTLSQAERDELELSVERTSVQKIMETLESVFTEHPAAKDKTIVFDKTNPEEMVRVDVTLLARVLTNMIKNALEAIPKGETVRVWFERDKGAPVFKAHNPGVIPERVALQIFKRSFSTKSEKGRGIGTYSMKLFGERYLRGKVDFESAPEKGTIFFIALPE
ncbi:HAMP domain-containing histidine kinase [Candidatus Sumerlaeota bacterium]|nr:HAMP domain-containing histidine kinase [Candidatus Sumerlaeota bacterium]